jgi:hypothetical protein
MNVGQFNISLETSRSFLNELKLYKGRGVKEVGNHSQEIKKVSKTKNHKDIYDCAIRNFDYEFLLEDDSIFQFSFSEKELRYAFIQNPKHFVTKEEYLIQSLGSEEIDENNSFDDLMCLVDENEYEQFLNEQKLNTLSNIIRYDATFIGHKPLLHSYAHLHIGMNNNLRIPVSIDLTPLVFVRFCIKNTYYKVWKNAIEEIEYFRDSLMASKELCNILDGEKWSQIEEADLYLK